ncbi:iron complex outermembrane receptor protein [Novosphingobium hassiacum]|uniref:Iron complex outermembrane receptor protein n=1 Tax=Novosphingobium hassiacum TaxID=173676 RepID=A0A7W6EW30_9SPHN|nr:TonB-dependent receptor [Novosphingobium hassiacum]MBB3860972.1 iron complex outermembrane receptor protein [Novosphingobium hassiacum]
MRTFLLATCAIGVATCPGLAFAQSTARSTAAQASASADEPQEGVADIVVTAQRRAENLQRVPIAVTAINAARLETLGVRSVADIAKFTPSLSLDPSPSSPAFGSILNLRGQATTGGILQLEPTVGVYLDGVYMPGQGGFSAGNVLDVAQIEVLKGPQGTLYGRNTTGGAISITTAQPTDEFEGRVNAGIGNFGRRELNGVINIPLAEGLSTRFVAGYTNDDGFVRDLRSGQRLGNAESFVARGTLKAEMGAVTAVVRGDYTHAKGNGAPWQPVGILPNSPAATEYAAQKNGAAFTTPFFLFNTPVASGGCGRLTSTSPACLTAAQTFGALLAAAPGQAASEQGAGKAPNVLDRAFSSPGKSDVQFGGVSLDLSTDVGAVTLRSITGLRWLDNIVESDLDGLPQNILFSPNHQYARTFSQELQAFGKAIDNRLDYILGAYYYRMTGYEYNFARALPTINPNNPNTLLNDLGTKSWSVFGQTTFSLTDKLDVTGGLRYTDDRKTEVSRSFNPGGCQVPVADRINGACLGRFRAEADNFSYLVRVTYKPSDDLLFYAVHSTGFKGGGISAGSAAPGSYDPFLPEKAKNYEVGFKADLLDRKLRVNGAGFYVDYSDLQRSVVTVNASGAPVTRVTNAANARIQGLEAEVTVQPISHFTIVMTGSYTDAKYKKYITGVGATARDLSDRKFQGVSKWRGSISGNFRVLDGPTEVDLSGNYSYRSRFNVYEDASRNDPADHFQDGFGLAGARLTANHAATRTQVALWAQNIFDKRYRAASSDLSDTLGVNVSITGTPRTYGLSVTQQF